jgi:hypothetical protein
VLSGRTASCFSVEPFGRRTNLGDVGGWEQPETTDVHWEQYAAELELEVGPRDGVEKLVSGRKKQNPRLQDLALLL